MSKTYTKFIQQIRTDWVKDWAVEFLKGLDLVPTPEIETYCKGMMEEFSGKCQEKSPEPGTDSWKSSAVSYLTGVRKAIKSWQESIELSQDNSYEHKNKEGVVIRDHKALLYMNYGRDFLNEVKAKSDTKKQEQRRNLVPINNVSEIQETIEKACLSSDWRELAAGIEFALGARIGEVLLTAEIEQLNQFQVQFKGQIKTKDEDRLEYPKYTLIESFQVVDALLKLRRMAENKEIRGCLLSEVDSRQNASVNRKVRELFSELLQPPHGVERISSHKLRSGHAAIAFYLFGGYTQSFGSFIKDNLGHKGDGEAANYEDYYVADFDGKPMVQGAWLERLKEKPGQPTQEIVQPRIRVTRAAKELLDDQEFLPFPDQVSRIEELIRLAKLGKQFEEGKLVKEVMTVVEVEKPVEKIVEKVVEVPVEKIVEKVVEVPVEKVVEKVVEVPVEKVVEKSVEVSAEKVKEVVEAAVREIIGMIPVEEIIKKLAASSIDVVDHKNVEAPTEKAVEKVVEIPTEKAVEKLAEVEDVQVHNYIPDPRFDRIRPAVEAVKAYNEGQYSKDTMWAINTQVLTDLTGCRSGLLKDFLDSTEGRLTVKDYNLEKGFSFHHNKGKGSITEFVRLESAQNASTNTPTAPQSRKTITLQATRASMMDIEHALRAEPDSTVVTKDNGKAVATYRIDKSTDLVVTESI